MVGEITAVNSGAVRALLADGRIPVVSSVATGEDGQIYNVNADTAAGALAVALGAAKLVVLTDVAGLYQDWPPPAPPAVGCLSGQESPAVGCLSGQESPAVGCLSGQESRVVSQVTAAGLDAMLPSLSAGMIPKMTACLDAVRGGVPQAHVLDGRLPHAVLLEIFTDSGIGTMVVPDGSVT
jgi:acetylglutamate kinase